MSTVLATVGGAIASLFVVLLLQEPLQGILARVFGGLGISRGETVKGVWLASWEIAGIRDLQGLHVVRLRQFGRKVVGRTLAADEVHGQVTLSASLEGRVLTGTWRTLADERALHHGAFQLVLQPNGATMSGKYVGFDRANRINHGKWEWKLKAANGTQYDTEALLAGDESTE